MKKKVKKEKIMSGKAGMNDENLLLDREGKDFEAVVRFWQDMLLEGYFLDLLGDSELEDVLFEKRKEEANQPMYLLRYE